MAIFTSKADTNLPFLTWIAQVDTKKPDELKALYGHFTPSRAERELMKTAEGTIMREVEGLTSFGQSVVWALHDREGITKEQEQRMCQLIKRSLETRVIGFGGQSTPDGEIVPLEHLRRYVSSLYISGFERRMLFELERLISEIQMKRANLLKCEECSNIFPIYTEEPKRFCSHRCAARNGTRRRRKSLMLHQNNVLTMQQIAGNI